MEATALPGRTAAELEAAGAASTAREILQQPALWCEIEALMQREAPRVRAFLDPLLARPHLRIVLTGAGTSAYTGECLAPALTRALGRRVEVIATTDLVADPHGGLVRGVPTLSSPSPARATAPRARRRSSSPMRALGSARTSSSPAIPRGRSIGGRRRRATAARCCCPRRPTIAASR